MHVLGCLDVNGKESHRNKSPDIEQLLYVVQYTNSSYSRYMDAMVFLMNE